MSLERESEAFHIAAGLKKAGCQFFDDKAQNEIGLRIRIAVGCGLG